MEYSILLLPIFTLAMSGIILPLFYRYDFYIRLSLLKKLIITILSSIFSTLVLWLITDKVISKIKYDLFLRGLLPPLLLLALCIIGIFILTKSIKVFDKSIIKDNEIISLNKKIDHKDTIIAKLRSQKHDYLKHLQVVSSLLNTDLKEDAKNYISNIANSFRSKTSRYGKVSYLDAICALKYEECLLKGISFDTYIQDFIDNLVIEPNEMSSVLLNILDNAIDALSSIKKDKKYIKLTIHEDEFQYVISIINNGPMIYDTEKIFTEGHSSKIGENRGYGLYSTKQILEKYNYHIFVDSDEFVTEFTILIPKY